MIDINADEYREWFEIIRLAILHGDIKKVTLKKYPTLL